MRKGESGGGERGRKGGRARVEGRKNWKKKGGSEREEERKIGGSEEEKVEEVVEELRGDEEEKEGRSERRKRVSHPVNQSATKEVK